MLLGAILAVTGVLLIFEYTPSPDAAYESMIALQTEVNFGNLIRNLHHWSGNLMVVVGVLHMLRVFYTAGFLFVEPFVEALKRCGRDLTREKLVKELEGMKDFKGIGGRISYGKFDAADPTCREGMRDIFIIQCVQGGKTKKLTDWMRME